MKFTYYIKYVEFLFIIKRYVINIYIIKYKSIKLGQTIMYYKIINKNVNWDKITGKKLNIIFTCECLSYYYYLYEI